MRTPSFAGSHAWPRPWWATRRTTACAQALSHRVEVLARHDRAADGGALLARLHGHLARDLLDEELELLVVGHHLGAEDGAIERIGLGVERDRLLDEVRVHAQLGGGVGAAGEGDDVGAFEAIEQVPGAADHELQRALGHQA